MNNTTLHRAFDAYLQSIGEPGDQLRPADHHRRQMVTTLKCHAPDLMLADLTFDACDSLFQHWRLRPTSTTGRPYSHSFTKKLIGELSRFLRWLGRSSEFDWHLPQGFDDIDRRVRTTQADCLPFQRDVYSISELALLNKYATEVDRLMLYLALNCGLHAVDLLRLKAGDFLFDHQHEKASQFGFASSECHSFLRLVRPHTRVYCEWLLWNETASSVRRANEHAHSMQADHLFLSSDGRPLLREEVKNPSAPIAIRYRRLANRVCADRPSFRGLPFSALERTGGEMLRQIASTEVVGLYLGHSVPHERLFNRPFGHLHQSLLEMRRVLEPVLNPYPIERV